MESPTTTEEYEPSQHEHDSSSEESMQHGLQSDSPDLSASLAPQSSKLESSASKKRKSKISGGVSSRIKRPKTDYNDAYRELLNHVILEVSRGEINDSEPLSATQHGATRWSSREKQIFFTALARKGRLDVRSITVAIGSKSEPEVHEYLRLLHQGHINRHLHDPASTLVEMSDVPAAFEISSKCVSAMDQAAEALSEKQFNYDREMEKKAHGRCSILDQEIARDLEGKLGNDKSPGCFLMNPEVAHAVNILNLRIFLELSEWVFMNSSQSRDNWRHIGEGQKPSIVTTAFLDFHHLFVTVMKRLVSTAIFLATSRIRSKSTRKYKNKNFVKKKDVILALNLLHMGANSREFWVGAARRCALRVRETDEKNRIVGSRLDYDEVERRLKQTNSRDPSLARPAASGTRSADEKEEESSSEGGTGDENDRSEHFEYHPGRSTTEDETGFSEGDSPLEGKAQTNFQRNLNKARHHYTELLDRQASLEEEQRIWEMLGKPSSSEIKFEGIDIPPRPPHARKSTEDLVDWRDWIDYQPPWERYEAPIPPANFTYNRRLNKRSNSSEFLRVNGNTDCSSASVSDASVSNIEKSNEEADKSIPPSNSDKRTTESEGRRFENEELEFASTSSESLEPDTQRQHRRGSSVSESLGGENEAEESEEEEEEYGDDDEEERDEKKDNEREETSKKGEGGQLERAASSVSSRENGKASHGTRTDGDHNNNRATNEEEHSSREDESSGRSAEESNSDEEGSQDPDGTVS